MLQSIRQQRRIANQSGFTLIELLVVVSIIGVLALIAITQFSIYREDAEYAKAETSLRNARTALEFGTEEITSDDGSVPYTQTTLDSAALPVDLAEIMPGATLSPDVVLGVQFNYCEDPETLDINQLVTAFPCKASTYTLWLRFCNGLELPMGPLPLPAGACDAA